MQTVSDKVLISRIYKGLLKLNSKKKSNQKLGKRYDIYFTKDYTQTAILHMKRCSTSLTMKGMQIKATRRYQYTFIEMAG